jgi:N6-L-threonylcarbamoyladenine synthase
MLILGIESTCDETAAAIVRDGEAILSQTIASQIEIHQKYGGVFPEIASRHHLEIILPVIEKTLSQASLSFSEIDAIAVAKGPGLIGSLLIGVNVAKTLSLCYQKPLIGINHVEAHLYAAMMGNPKIFPSLGVVISGGHTLLIKIQGVGQYEAIGTTIDDAIGEAFDKVASILDLPYPGGPSVENLAKEGNPNKYPFKAGKCKDLPFHFSFSGLKTKVLYTVKGQGSKKNSETQISQEEKPHIAASFQQAALLDVIEKALLAARTYDCKALYFGGGVSNNQTLRIMLQEKKPQIPIYFPSKGLSLDNAAMIAGLAFHKRSGQEKDPFSLQAQSRLPVM